MAEEQTGEPFRYKIELDTSGLESTFARIDQQVSAAIASAGARPLDVFAGAERRFQVAEAIGIPYGGRRLSVGEAAAVTAEGRPSLAFQAGQMTPLGPLVEGFFGIDQVVRQQQATAAAGLLTQMGTRVTNQEIRDMRDAMAEIERSDPRLRGTDVALAMSLLQEEGRGRGFRTTADVQKAGKDVAKSLADMRDALGLTTEMQLRDLNNAMATVGVPLEDRGVVSRIVQKTSDVSGMPMGDAFNKVMMSGGLAMSHNLHFEMGARGAAVAEASISQAMRNGLTPDELFHLGGPDRAAAFVSNGISAMLGQDVVQQAVAVSAERYRKRTGEIGFDLGEFQTALRAGTRPSESVQAFFQENRVEIQKSAAEHTINMAGTYSQYLVGKIGKDKAQKGLTQLFGDRPELARAFLDTEGTLGEMSAASAMNAGRAIENYNSLQGVVGRKVDQLFQGTRGVARGIGALISYNFEREHPTIAGLVQSLTPIDRAAEPSSKVISFYSRTGELFTGKNVTRGFKQDLMTAGVGRDLVDKIVGDDTINLQMLEDEMISKWKDDPDQAGKMFAATDALRGRAVSELSNQAGGMGRRDLETLVGNVRSLMDAGKATDIQDIDFTSREIQFGLSESVSKAQLGRAQKSELFQFAVSSRESLMRGQAVITAEEREGEPRLSLLQGFQTKIRPTPPSSGDPTVDGLVRAASDLESAADMIKQAAGGLASKLRPAASGRTF